MEAAHKDLSVLRCSYEDEETLTVALDLFKPHIEVDAIRPDVALPREVSLCPLPYPVSQALFKRTMFVAERPRVWGRRSAFSAGIMSPVEIPFR